MKVEEFLSKNQQKNIEELENNKELEALKKARDQEYFNVFKIESHIIQSQIQAYFEDCLKKWNALIDLIVFVEYLSDEVECGKRLEVINDQLKHDKGLNSYEPLNKPVEKEENIKLVLKTLLIKTVGKFKKSHSDKLIEAKKKFKERDTNKQLKEIDDELEAFKEILSVKDVDAWYEVKHVIVDRKNEVITNILNSKSSFFHPEMKNKKD